MSTVVAPRVPTLTERTRRACEASRDVERFAYRIVDDAQERGDEAAQRRALEILRTAKGLRRMLDNWRSHGE